MLAQHPPMKTPARILVLTAIFHAAPLLCFGAAYIESVNGDLSGDRLNPTQFTLEVGVNTLTGSVISGDLDYLTINIPSGFEFTSFSLTSYTGTGTLTKSFVGIQSGTTFTVTPATATAGSLLGYAHFGPTGAQGEILDDMGNGAGAMGFTPPLPAGDYTFWIQETSGTVRNYGFTLNVAPVPEPAAWTLCLAGLGIIGLCARRAGLRNCHVSGDGI